jgi:hypothetical protein
MRLQYLLFAVLFVFTNVVALHCEARTQKIRYTGVCFRQHMTDGKTELTKALVNARNALNLGLSPGGNLQTADEQSDAAYAGTQTVLHVHKSSCIFLIAEIMQI